MEYAELHAHTNFSFLDGSSDPEAMAETAARLGLRALAITDHNSLSGIVRFGAAAQAHGVHPITGIELSVEPPPPARVARLDPSRPCFDGVSSRLDIDNSTADVPEIAHLVLLAENLGGYRNLCTLLTEAYRHGGLDAPRIPWDVLARHADGLVALSGCDAGEVPRALARGGPEAAHAIATRYRDTFGRDRFAIELHRHGLPADGPRNAALQAVAARLDLVCVATQDAHYHDPSRARLHHVVTCIRHGTTLAQAGALLRPNDEYRLKSGAEMARRFREERARAASPAQDPVRATVAIAEQCAFTLHDLRYEFPRPRLPHGESALSFLTRLVHAGKVVFYPDASDEVEARLAHELDIVDQLSLAGYLLVFKEIVDWSQSQGILVSMRGSAPASAMLHCMGLCPIDPLEHGLLFERFCSPERREYPDIDLDFPHERREEVIQHIYEKYGRTHAAMVCEVISYQSRSAVRDVAKVLGLPTARAQRLADLLDYRDADPLARLSAEGIRGRLADLLVDLTRQLADSPRHLSIHVGGMVISSEPLNHVTPVLPARMEARTVLPWDKDDLTILAETFNVQLIKMDLLSLGMLSAIGRCFDHVADLTGERLDLHGFRYDPGVYDRLCAADTVGLFQVESRAQQAFLPRLRPRNLADTAISVGAIRPGPGAARAGEHIVRRRQGREPITYPAHELIPALRETYGVLLWQEQCIQVAVIAAGYTPGEADQLRRAMSHKRSEERMRAVCAEMVDRMTARGYDASTAEAVRDMVVGFAGYGFPRAHAYPFAHLALISATLRLRYPEAYYAALLNCQPMGFYAPHTLLWDAHRHGVRVLPVHVNRSAWESVLEPLSPPIPISREVGEGRTTTPSLSRGVGEGQGVGVSDDRLIAIRLGMREVHGLGPAARETFEAARANGPFRSIADLVVRTGFDRDRLESLAEVGALLGLPSGATTGRAGPGRDRRATAWVTGELAGIGPAYLPGLAEQLVTRPDLEPMSAWEEVQAEYRTLGYAPNRHAVAWLRPALDDQGAVTAAGLVRQRHGRVARAGGLVICRQRPETAGGVLFLTVEDETGLFNAIVQAPVYERLRRVLRGEGLVVLEGPVQQRDGTTHLMVRQAWPLRPGGTVAVPSPVGVRSHDFR
jgi:error-prone DNA polymerase